MPAQSHIMSTKQKMHNQEKIKERHSSKLPGIANFWSVNSENTVLVKRKADNSDERQSKSNKKQRLTATERYQKYIEDEERIKQVEEEMTQNSDPHTPESFERALMKDRNSSFMWIKYMAFHLETAEIEKARSIAKKAIASINYREEKELLNVWIALLNLEINYGNDETYQETLREATIRNDPYSVYSKTLAILLELEKNEDANKIIDILKKKFKPKPEMWLLVAESYLKMKNIKYAKELLPKSLLSLKDSEHLDYMVKYALMITKYDLHDYSQTIFEKILSSYNKRLPIWFTYIDMMTKNGQIEIARSLFERMLIVEFPMKKLKSIFQKYVEFETKHGDSTNISKVKMMAKKMLKNVKDDDDE